MSIIICQALTVNQPYQVPAAPVLKRENKKRKVEDYTSATTSEPTTIKRGKTADKKDKPPAERKSKNTAVYVTGLPLDAELDELVDRFSKCGVIEEDEEGEPKVKMYALEDGTFNGEALVVYFKEDSVTLALNILDDAELRLGQPSTVMKVSKADFAHKQQRTGDHDKPRRTVDKKKTTKRIGKMQRSGSFILTGFNPLLVSPENLRNGATTMALVLNQTQSQAPENLSKLAELSSSNICSRLKTLRKTPLCYWI